MKTILTSQPINKMPVRLDVDNSFFHTDVFNFQINNQIKKYHDPNAVNSWLLHGPPALDIVYKSGPL